MQKLMFVLLSWTISSAFANGCPGQFDPVSGICRFQGNNGELIQYNAAPPKSTQRQSPPQKKIVYVSKYGAVATNEKTGISSGALNKDSIEEAKNEAIKACEQGGRNAPCKVAIWVGNACIAAATGKEGKRFRVFYTAREKPGQAEPAALKQCKKAGLKNCEITIPEGCSFP